MHGSLPYLSDYKPAKDTTDHQHYIPKEFRLRLINHIASVLKLGEPTVFAFESACRHGLRTQFCNTGWPWDIADETAARIVSAALAQIGARRPTWEQGQPEWAQYGVVLFERTRCVTCGNKLPEENKKYCSPHCGLVHRWEIADDDKRKANKAHVTAYYAAQRANAELRNCARCGLLFKPGRPTQIYCSRKCAGKTAGAAAVERKRQKWHSRKNSTGAGAASNATE